MANLTANKTQYMATGGDVPVLPEHGFALALSDTDTYDPGVFVYAGAAGTINAVPSRGDRTTAVSVTVVAGGMVPFRCYQVKTGGSATGLIGVL